MVGGEIILGHSLFEWISLYGYYILPLLIVFLGPLAGFAGGFFASLGIMNPFAVFAIWVVTTTTTDSLFFVLGKFGRKILNKFKRSREIVERIHQAEEASDDNWVKVFRTHFIKIFFFVKISPTVTITDVLAVIGGLLDIEFRRLYIASFLGQLIWSGMFVAMGFYFGGAVQDISFLINTSGLVFAGVFIIGFLYVRYAHQYFASKMSTTMLAIKDVIGIKK